MKGAGMLLSNKITYLHGDSCQKFKILEFQAKQKREYELITFVLTDPGQ